MNISSFNIMQRKSTGLTLNKYAVAIGLLKCCLCSSIIISIGASSSTDMYTQASASLESSSTDVANPSYFSDTEITSTPTVEITGASDTEITSTPTVEITGASDTEITSTPTVEITGAFGTEMTSNLATETTDTIFTDVTNVFSTKVASAISDETPSSSTSEFTSADSEETPSILTSEVTSTHSTQVTRLTTSIMTPDITDTVTAEITGTFATTMASTVASEATSSLATEITSSLVSEITSTVSTQSTGTSSEKPSSTPTAPTTSTPDSSERPLFFPMPTENRDIALHLQVKLTNGNFTGNLNISSSSEFHELVVNVTQELTPAFNTTGKLANLTVTGFWNGSVGIDFTSYYKNVNIGDLYSSLFSLVLNESIFNGSVLNDSIYNEFKTFCEQNDSCPKDYQCSVDRSRERLQPTCEHLCYQHSCQNRGYCVVNEQNQPVCKCLETDDYIYSGDACDVKTEKLTMSKDKIIGIAAGVGGGLILLLIIVIVIICVRQRQHKRSKEDQIIDNASEQSFQSFKGSEDGIHQPTPSSRQVTTPANSHSMYRLPEERAENPRFNPYLSLPNVQQDPARQLDLSQGFFPAADRTRESSRNIKAKSQQFQDRVPDYGDPVQIPRFRFDPRGSDYISADNKRSQSPVPKTNNTRRDNQHGGPMYSSAEPKVYDYSNDLELMASGYVHPLNNTDLYDFSYENQSNDYSRHGAKVEAYDFPLDHNVKQRNGMKDPYSVKMRLV